MSTAHISSPEVLKKFRRHFVKFDDECRQALGSVRSDVFRVAEWLKRDQHAYWKRELRRREEMVERARSEYIRAVAGEKYHGKSSGFDEKKLLAKAQRLKAEAEMKMEKVKRWSWVIEQKAGKLLMPCTALSTLLENLTPKALARLDQMLDSLDDYLRPAGAHPSAGGPAECTD